MAPYRVLVVDDSAFMRKLFTDIIAGNSAFAICGTAATGAEAVALLEELKPDVITMDLEMPEMNGLEALRAVMARRPTPVIMLSGISEQNTRETIAALQLGAFDFIRKPSGMTSDIGRVAEELLVRLKMAVTVNRLKMNPLPERPAYKPAKPVPPPKPSPQTERERKDDRAPAKNQTRAKPSEPRSKSPEESVAQLPVHSTKRPSLKPDTSGQRSFRHLIAVGTSTGGPRALHQLLSSLPGDLPAPVLIVQHMPPKFTRSLAQRLNSFSELAVKEAEHGDKLIAGTAYLSPGGSHMRIIRSGDEYYVELSQDSPRNGHRPSVDVLFESLVPFDELVRHAVVMTGMGSDGAKGLKALAEHGAATTIAESEETCVVYGMPRSAIEEGAAQTVLPLHHIGPELLGAMTK